MKIELPDDADQSSEVEHKLIAVMMISFAATFALSQVYFENRLTQLLRQENI